MNAYELLENECSVLCIFHGFIDVSHLVHKLGSFLPKLNPSTGKISVGEEENYMKHATTDNLIFHVTVTYLRVVFCKFYMWKQTKKL